jgi:hypothetical protein
MLRGESERMFLNTASMESHGIGIPTLVGALVGGLVGTFNGDFKRGCIPF